MEMHRSRSREKPRRVSDPMPAARSHPPSSRHSFAEGNIQSKDRNELLSTKHDPRCQCGSAEDGNLITLEFKRNYSKKTSEMPIKALIDEEMSREKHTKRSSPSLIARLMGLDSLPSPGASKPPKEVRSSSKKVLSKEFHEKATLKEDRGSINDEHQEFKDVFEVVQVPRVEMQKDEIVKKLIACRRHHEIEQQSFSDTASRSTKRMPSGCKEIVDSVDTLDPKKEICLPFMLEPSKHLHNLTCSPFPPHAIYPSVLMASKGSPASSCQSSFRSEKNVERYIHLEGDDTLCFRKVAANRYNHPSREHLCSLLQKLSETTYTEKNGYCTQPTQIVILKPSLDKAQKAERTIPSTKSLNNLQYSLKNSMKFPVDESMELYTEERASWQKLLDNDETMGRKGQMSKKISEGITKQMKNPLASGRQKVSVENTTEYEKDKGSCTTSSIMKGKNSQSSLLTSAMVYGYSNSSSSHSPLSSPTESSVTKEARKRLSERLKSTNRFQEEGFLNRASSTLAEMLTFSDSETPIVTLGSIPVKKAPERKLDPEDFPEPINQPLGISCKNGCKNDFCRSLPRSKSLPALNSIHGKPHLNSRNRPRKIVKRIMPKMVDDTSNWMSLDNDPIRQKKTTLRNLKYLSGKEAIHLDSEETTLIERDIHVSSEELKNSNDLRNLAEKQQIAIERLRDSTELSDVADKVSVFESNTDKLSLSAKGNESPPRGPLVYHDKDEIPAANSDKSAPVLPGSYNEADQPSPVSVLEVPFEEEEEFTSDCFEEINADLQELRKQLRLLKLESRNTSKEDGETPNSSDGDPGSLQLFKDEEERDYSYILDILTDSEDHKGEFNFPFTEHPVDLHVFEKLEMKYKLFDSWSRSDRKLLFDLTNFILPDIMEQNGYHRSTMVREGVADEVWQKVIKEKAIGSGSAESIDGIRWADVGDDKELVGRQVQNMLQEDLVDELVVELASLLLVV